MNTLYKQEDTFWSFLDEDEGLSWSEYIDSAAEDNLLQKMELLDDTYDMAEANATAITAEKNRAEGVEAGLQSQIDFITSNTDAAAIDSLTEVVNAFQNADGNLENSITNLSTAAADDRALIRSELATAEAALQGNIDAEKTRAEGVEAGLLSQIESNDADIAALQSDLENLSGAGGFATDAELQAAVDSLTSADGALSARIQVFEEVEWAFQKFTIEQGDLDNGYVSISLDKGTAYSGYPAFVFVDRLAAFEDEDFYFDVQPDGVTVHIVFTGLVDGMSSEQLAVGDEVRVKFVRRC